MLGWQGWPAALSVPVSIRCSLPHAYQQVRIVRLPPTISYNAFDFCPLRPLPSTATTARPRRTTIRCIHESPVVPTLTNTTDPTATQPTHHFQ